jgi:hypothetical protein
LTPPQTQVSDLDASDTDEPLGLAHPCPCCVGRMNIIETFLTGHDPSQIRATKATSACAVINNALDQMPSPPITPRIGRAPIP